MQPRVPADRHDVVKPLRSVNVALMMLVSASPWVMCLGQGESVHICGIIANCGEELLSRANSTPYKVQLHGLGQLWKGSEQWVNEVESAEKGRLCS